MDHILHIATFFICPNIKILSFSSFRSGIDRATLQLQTIINYRSPRKASICSRHLSLKIIFTHFQVELLADDSVKFALDRSVEMDPAGNYHVLVTIHHDKMT